MGAATKAGVRPGLFVLIKAIVLNSKRSRQTFRNCEVGDASGDSREGRTFDDSEF